MTSPAQGLSDRDRSFLLQSILNTYDDRNRTELERIARRLLEMVPGVAAGADPGTGRALPDGVAD